MKSGGSGDQRRHAKQGGERRRVEALEAQIGDQIGQRPAHVDRQLPLQPALPQRQSEVLHREPALLQTRGQLEALAGQPALARQHQLAVEPVEQRQRERLLGPTPAKRPVGRRPFRAQPAQIEQSTKHLGAGLPDAEPRSEMRPVLILLPRHPAGEAGFAEPRRARHGRSAARVALELAGERQRPGRLRARQGSCTEILEQAAIVGMLGLHVQLIVRLLVGPADLTGKIDGGRSVPGLHLDVRRIG